MMSHVDPLPTDAHVRTLRLRPDRLRFRPQATREPAPVLSFVQDLPREEGPGRPT